MEATGKKSLTGNANGLLGIIIMETFKLSLLFIVNANVTVSI